MDVRVIETTNHETNTTMNELVREIEKSYTRSGEHNVTTQYKAAFYDLAEKFDLLLKERNTLSEWNQCTMNAGGDLVKQIAQLTKERDDFQKVASELAVKCDQFEEDNRELGIKYDNVLRIMNGLSDERNNLRDKLEEERVSNEGLYNDLHSQLEILKTERDQLAAKCAEMVDGLKFWQEMYPKELALAEKNIELCKKENDTHGVNFHEGLKGGLISHDIFLSRMKHAASDQCGVGWLSPEKKNEIEERHCMEMAAVMTATMQNTESTVKDRIPKDNPYWTQAYGDVCVAIDREMKLIKQKKVLVEALQTAIDFPNAHATQGILKQALEKTI